MPNLKSEIRNLKSAGFTLLEVILALTLTSVVVIAIGVAIDVHLRLLDTGRTEVEEAQLARALLRRIADDLRSAVLYNPIDAEKLLPDAAALPGDLSDLAGAAELAGEAGLDSEDLKDAESDRTGNLTVSSAPPSVPGLYGNQYVLQVDTSRLPRADQFGGMISTAGDVSVVDPVSDVKTVTYGVVDDPQDKTAYTSGVSQGGGGLVRYERDRAITAFAAEQGRLADWESKLEPIAPEVAGIEFLYFDGTEPVEEWDSVERGGLPMAVKITLYIIPARLRNSGAEGSSRRTANQWPTIDGEDYLVYSLVVHLPAAEPTSAEDLSEESWEETESDPETGGTAESGSGEGLPLGEGSGR